MVATIKQQSEALIAMAARSRADLANLAALLTPPTTAITPEQVGITFAPKQDSTKLAAVCRAVQVQIINKVVALELEYGCGAKKEAKVRKGGKGRKGGNVKTTFKGPRLAKIKTVQNRQRALATRTLGASQRSWAKKRSGASHLAPQCRRTSPRCSRSASTGRTSGWPRPLTKCQYCTSERAS